MNITEVVKIMMDDEIFQILQEKYPKCDIEVLNINDWELEKLIEFITDDIIIKRPYVVRCFKNMFRFMIKAKQIPDKIYYINDISDEDLALMHAGFLKFAWQTNFTINVFKDVDPIRDILKIQAKY